MFIRKDRQASLRSTFITHVLLPPTVPFLLLGVVGYINLTHLVRNASINQLTRGASAASSEVAREFSIRQGILQKTGEQASTSNIEYLTKLSQITNPVQAAALTQVTRDKLDNQLLGAYTSFFTETSAVAVLDAKQQPIASNGSADLIKRYTSAAAGVHSTQDGTYVTIVQPYKNGTVLAVVQTNNEQFLKPAWQATPRPSAGTLVLIADTKGKVVYPKQQADVQVGSTKSVHDSIKVTVEGKQYLGQSNAISSTGWHVYVGQPEAEVTQPLHEAQVIAISAIIISLTVSLVLGYIYIDKTTRAIQKLVIGARTFMVHNLDYKITLNTNNELQTLAESMNAMAAVIKSTEELLANKNREFISVATHEIKAPMTAIIGSLSMVLEDGEGKVDSEARDLLDMAYQGTQRLRDLVSDLLDVAHLEEGSVTLETQPVDLVQMIQTIVQEQQIAAQKAGITLTAQLPQGPYLVMADPTKLRVVITNFVSNGIKYNRENGFVQLGIQDQQGQAIVSIQDNGLGIPPDQQARMFQKFFRVQHSDRASVPGTGLGMYITKQYIEAMQGQLSFQSVHGEGTTFFFSLPRAQ